MDAFNFGVSCAVGIVLLIILGGYLLVSFISFFDNDDRKTSDSIGVGIIIGILIAIIGETIVGCLL